MPAAASARPDWGMVFVRIGLGALLLFEGLRLYRDRVGPELVESTAHRMSVAPEVYAWFGSNIVLRYPSFFAWAIVAGLFASGAALFVGALVRPASVAVLFLMANFHFAGPAVKEEYRALIAIVALGCFIAGAGMRVGLDAYLVGRFPAWITWSR